MLHNTALPVFSAKFKSPICRSGVCHLLDSAGDLCSHVPLAVAWGQMHMVLLMLLCTGVVCVDSCLSKFGKQS